MLCAVFQLPVASQWAWWPVAIAGPTLWPFPIGNDELQGLSGHGAALQPPADPIQVVHAHTLRANLSPLVFPVHLQNPSAAAAASGESQHGFCRKTPGKHHHQGLPFPVGFHPGNDGKALGGDLGKQLKEWDLGGVEGMRGLSWDPATPLPDDATPAPPCSWRCGGIPKGLLPKFSPPGIQVAPPRSGMAVRKSGNGVSVPHPALGTPSLGQQLRCSTC